MNLLDAYFSGARLTIELTGYPESRRRITSIRRDGDQVMIFDGQEEDLWSSRPPTCIDLPLPDDGPPWVLRNHTILAR